MTHAPRPWIDGVSTLGIVLLLLGAVFVAIYVSRMH